MNTRAGHVDEVIQMIGGAIPAFGDALGRVAGDAQALTLFATLVSSDVLEGEIRIRGGEAATGDTDHQGSVTAPLPEGEMTLSVTPAPAPPGGGRAWVVRVTGIASAAKSGVLALDRAEGVTINVE
jgi:hypothetical protein